VSDTISDYESLIAHPAWLAFRAHVEQEWGPSGKKYQQELDQALNTRNIDHACQIRSGQKVIAALMRWPEEELLRIRRQQPSEAEPVMSRRGSL
jgi:hypothetical protein